LIQPSAIWDRHELPVQSTSTRFFSFAIGPPCTGSTDPLDRSRLVLLYFVV
jgi:hypothetical protein